jgi:hypothetical protein
MFVTPYRPARLPGTRHPGPLPLPQHRAGDRVAPDAVTLTRPARPRQRLQNATWSYTGSGTVSPVVSSICVASVTT